MSFREFYDWHPATESRKYSGAVEESGGAVRVTAKDGFPPLMVIVDAETARLTSGGYEREIRELLITLSFYAKERRDKLRPKT